MKKVDGTCYRYSLKWVTIININTRRKNKKNVPMLKRCGIREHVCDILEGGENAFRDRENKYGFFKI